MTRAVRDRILKDANGSISDHLRNHIHLTNCIHLKNHMHKHSPILTDRSLMRELVVLQRSRSLRDPSTSPPSWQSPSVVDLLPKFGENDMTVPHGRRSVGIECQRSGRRLSGSSPPLANLPRTKFPAREVIRHNGRVAAVSERSSKSGIQERRKIKGEEPSGTNLGPRPMGGNDERLQDGTDLLDDIVLKNTDREYEKVKQKGKHREDVLLKTLSEQLNEVRTNSGDATSSHIYLHGRHTQNEVTCEEAEASAHGYCSGLSRIKRRKFRGARRTRAAVAARHSLPQNEMSVASNSLAQGSAHPKYHMEEEEDEYADHNIMRGPGNGCGIPWNWSRIHHRGKTILDKAGRSLACGLSDSKLKRGGPLPRGRDVSDMPIMSDQSSSSSKSDAEALPLLVEASGSHGSTENAGWVHDYSGELGIYADNLLKNEIDSDLASEARSGDRHKFRGRRNGCHQNLTQKYMPRTFRDLVGQNLVAQALANAVAKRKVGLLYVFYGPHGTGKTSCARIFARALNCQSLDHPKPCGFCDSCVAHDMGKSRNIRELGPVSNFDFESIMDLIDNVIVSRSPSPYRVFIFDDCDTLTPDCWSSLSKVFDRAPRRVVFVLVSSNLDVLPHVIISRCQKFFFPKLKDADIIYTLQWIATKEDLEIDKDALKLVASRSDGSLRDAEMTLEQLSLLGQRISVPLVQELVGLISDEKLVDLLDLALSADTVNTVKNLREIMESGVEPLALMSQLATVITDILAGSYDLTKERPRRKFFRQQGLSKEDMEKLRQALKTLSEAEKQLRTSNDRVTWLTAALLQLAPDHQYMLPSSSTDSGFNHSPLVLSNVGGRERPRRSNVERAAMLHTEKGLSAGLRKGNIQAGSSSDIYCSGQTKVTSTDRKRNTVVGMLPEQIFTDAADMDRVNGRLLSDKVHLEIEEIWLEVLGMIQVNGLQEFMYQEGKLVSVSFGAAPTVQLMFSSHLTKSKGEKFRAHILKAFESVLGSPVTIEMRCESRKDERAGFNMPFILPSSQDCSSQRYAKPGLMDASRMSVAGYDDIRKGVPMNKDGLNQVQLLQSDPIGKGKSEIVEIVASPTGPKANGHVDNSTQSDRKDHESGCVGDAPDPAKKSALVSLPERRTLGDRNQSQSLVRGKVSLAHVIQQAEGCTQRNGWSKRKAVSIAEKLEQENLRLEPRSRSLLCWKASRVTRRKISRWKIRTRKPHTLLKIVSCGKCFSAKSPR